MPIRGAAGMGSSMSVCSQHPHLWKIRNLKIWKTCFLHQPVVVSFHVGLFPPVPSTATEADRIDGIGSKAIQAQEFLGVEVTSF